MQVTLADAIARLRAGEVVAFPTETVYGLGADARNPLAVRQVFALKRRPVDHPLIVHLADASWLPRWAQVPDAALALADRFWPGPLTIVLRKRPEVPDEVTGGLDTLGVRVPDHALALALLDGVGDGLAAPSANRFGHVSPTTAEHVRDELGDQLPILDGGPCRVGIESTIVDLSGLPVQAGGRLARGPALLRPGGVATPDIESVIGPLTAASPTRAPGTLPAHYAPHTALLLSAEPEREAAALRASGKRVAVLLAGDPTDHARRLYAELRRLDSEHYDVLVAQPSTDADLGIAINDRLVRAARGGGHA